MKRRGYITLMALLTAVPLAGAVWVRLASRAHSSEAPRLVEQRVARSADERPVRAASFQILHTGVIVSSETIQLAARMEGRVSEVCVHLGDHVRAGDRLVSLDKRSLRRQLVTLRAGGQVLAAEVDRTAVGASEAGSRLEHRRAAAALPIPAISGEELRTAEYRDQEAAIGLRAAKARVGERLAQIAQLKEQLRDADVRAPFEGVVAARFVDPGASVERDAPLLRLVSSGPPLVRFAVPPEAASQFTRGTGVHVSVVGDATQIDARVENSSPEVDTAARLTVVEARFTSELALSRMSALVGRMARVQLAVEPTDPGGR